jgi:hypothetical protein
MVREVAGWRGAAKVDRAGWVPSQRDGLGTELCFRLMLRGGGRGSGGAGGLWRDIPAPRPLGAGSKARAKVASKMDRGPAPSSASLEVGTHGVPVMRTPGFEDDEFHSSIDEDVAINPKVLARRRRNRERRQRLKMQKGEAQAEARQNALEEAIRRLQEGSGVVAYFKTTSGKSKTPAVMTVARVDLTQAEVCVTTPKGRMQTVPVTWILAVRNTTHGATGTLNGSEEVGELRGSKTGQSNSTKSRWLDEGKFKQMLHRRRAKARQRRKQRHDRKRAEASLCRAQEKV